MSTTAVSSESRYKSFIKPVKFWDRPSSKVAPAQDQDQEQVKEVVTQSPPQHNGLLSSFSFSRKTVVPSSPSGHSYLEKTDVNVALKETGKGEIYKLSTVDDAGIYMPPSPNLQGKRDHWIEVNEDIMDFHLPSSECLTTMEDDNKRGFYTPSSFVHTQPYILPVHNMSDSSLSVPSLDDSNLSSSRSSASY
ncbi:hypothetical protein K501DRAFT_285788 [Backusella circina FSU 941]|nr:hypothetical protein K501DRAFT_285788 [Backusella circina FSU 941]